MPADDVAAVLARATAGLGVAGEHRRGQLQMAEAVHRAIGRGRHLVVQAGTGTGKSLAYLVPAAMARRPVVVATATKALQDQLAKKDLPALSRTLEQPLAFAVLKGRSNYLCLQRASEVAGDGIQPELDGTGSSSSSLSAVAESPAEGGLVEHVRRLIEWSASTETGDRGDLHFEPHPKAWGMLSVGPRECPGAHRCPSGGRCFAERARARAAEADIVVVNTHLYGAHLASGGAVLPSHDVVVFDEAHEVESVMTSSLGAEVTPGRLLALDTTSRPVLGDGADAHDLRPVAERLRAALVPLLGTRVLGGHERSEDVAPRGDGPRRRRRRLAEEPAGRERAFFHEAPRPRAGPARDAAAAAEPDPERERERELASVLEEALNRVQQLRSALVAAQAPTPTATATAIPAHDDAGARRQRAAAAAGHLAADLERLAARRSDEVAWVDGTARAPVLRLSPIDVAPSLAASLWGEVTAVLTSATVPPRVIEQLGLGDFDVDELDVGSPFDYRTQAMLYVARHLPDPRRADERRQQALHDELAALIEAAGGRTLALFTSRRATDEAAAALRERVACDVLVQGQLPKERLVERFAADETSCLFATLGLWQGIDVPGRSLSLVTIDRLPFGRPDDPLLEARRDRAGAAAFRTVDLPRAASLLAQGVGRLIRSAEDYGVVAVLDPRLATAPYRRTLLGALPPMRRTVRRSDVVDFFAAVLQKAGFHDADAGVREGHGTPRRKTSQSA